MMDINFKGEFKSLKSFQFTKLPDLTIIVGENGSGKTNLLQLIQQQLKGNPNLEVIVDSKKLKNVTANSFYNTLDDKWSDSDWKEKIDKLTSVYSVISPDYFDLISFFNSISSEVGEPITLWNFNETTILGVNYQEIRDKLATIRSRMLNSNSIRVPAGVLEFLHENIRFLSFYEDLGNSLRKDPRELCEKDFLSSPIPESLLIESDIFKHDIPNIFYSYAKRRHSNEREYLWHREHQITTSAVADEEFIKSHPQPWELLNNILEKCKFKYQFEGVNHVLFSEFEPINIGLHNPSTLEVVNTNDLSTGEKKILSLACSIFSTDFYKKSLELPELLLLDEPDAFLHPQMVKMLLDVLAENFIQNLGVKVILTTHSPTTIALSPEESIYQITNQPGTSLTKISKDSALNLLTSFIPTLSIDYRNHRQIFVEGPNDRYFYNTIFSKLSLRIEYDYKLYFISRDLSGKDSSSSVLDTVKHIREAGIKSAFGIIDWDTTNTSTDSIKVHGEKSRYSLENYLFDPINLTMLFLRYKFMNLHQILGLTPSYNEFDFPLEPIKTLETARDYFLTKITERKQLKME